MGTVIIRVLSKQLSTCANISNLVKHKRPALKTFAGKVLNQSAGKKREFINYARRGGRLPPHIYTALIASSKAHDTLQRLSSEKAQQHRKTRVYSMHTITAFD